jgi:alcohol dehydrogenase
MKIQGAVLERIGAEAPYAESKPLSISELELDPPGADELLVQIEAAGLCHSDLSVVDGNRKRPVPMLLGHEAAGRVIGRGSNVTDIREGQRVIMTFLPRCGQCDACATEGQVPCTVGSGSNEQGTLLEGGMRLHRNNQTVRHHLGVSAFATHAVVHRNSVVVVDNDVPADVAAVLGCAVLTGGGAVLNAARPKPGDTLMVIGLGGVGMAALMTAASLQDVRVIGVDTSPEKLKTALDLGADETYSSKQLTELHITATHVVEAAGNARAFEAAFNATAPGGRTVTVGLPSPDARISISPLAITAQARTIIGSYLGSAVPSRDIPRYVELWRQGDLPVEKLISDHIRLEDINQAMDSLASATALRQIVTFE